MSNSRKTDRELLAVAGSAEMRKDMDILTRRNASPFIKDGEVDADAYIEFVTQFNEFINHKPKPFRPMDDKNMKL